MLILFVLYLCCSGRSLDPGVRLRLNFGGGEKLHRDMPDVSRDAPQEEEAPQTRGAVQVLKAQPSVGCNITER